MEELVTVDGRQYKLTYDRPLTAEQKAQTIADIKRQSGCGSCGPKMTNLSNDWNYGGIRTMAPTCTATGKGSGDTVTLEAAPRQGIQPYSVEFLKAPADSTATDGSDATTIDIGDLNRTGVSTAPWYYTGGTKTTMLANPTSKVIDEAATSTDVMVHAEYILDDTDVGGATVKAGDLNGASIIFKVTVKDSCPTASGGEQTCSEICKAYVTCIPPTCNFIVS